MRKLFLIVLSFVSATAIKAQAVYDSSMLTPPQYVKDGQNKFAFFGDAEMTYSSNKNERQFGDVNFKPIFLWKVSDQLFVEAETEFETGGGSLDIGLEYVNMCYIVSKYVTLHAGRFLPKFGAYRGRFGEGFLNRFANDPVGFGDGGIGAMNEVGVGAQGGFGVGDSKINYDVYVSNGPILLTDTANAGQFEYEGYIGNNKGKAVGGRFGLLPLSNSSLEIGYSFQRKNKTGDPGSGYENTGLFMQAADLNYYTHLTAIQSDFRLLAEWKYQKVDKAVYFDVLNKPYTFKNNPSAYYIAAMIRPAHLQSFLHNLELAGRYSKFKTPVEATWGGGDKKQWDISLDYWLRWNSLVKFTYADRANEPKNFLAQVVFGF
ncbi:MAG TPA: hypothetical protein VL095_15330 [Flavisolibacter sp.]|nr:hypothetical protein [Flavisolibacter sp.]